MSEHAERIGRAYVGMCTRVVTDAETFWHSHRPDLTPAQHEAVKEFVEYAETRLEHLKPEATAVGDAAAG